MISQKSYLFLILILVIIGAFLFERSSMKIEPFYYNIRNQCQKLTGTFETPQKMLYNTIAPAYQTFEECQMAENPFQNLNREECLKQTGAGWCTDYLGDGICVRGTPSGPDDMYRHNLCYPNQFRSNTNAWTYE